MAGPFDNPYAQPNFGFGYGSVYGGGYGSPGTMYGGAPVFRNQIVDFTGMPGMNSMSGLTMNMLAYPLLAQFMGGYGMTPGQFAPTQNVFDHMRAHNLFMQNQMAMSQAAMADEMAYYRMIRGASGLTGQRFGLAQHQAATQMAHDVSSFMPFMVPMFPEVIDQLHGTRGSAQVMTHFMHLGGRFMRDPVSGMTGLSGDTAAGYSRSLFDYLYGPGRDVSDMRGIGAGEVGRLVDELNRRGYMGGGLTDRDRRSIASRFDPRAGDMGAGDFDKLIDSNPQVQEALRTGEAEQIGRRIKNLTGVVSAMRDIFGDIGRPNAPLPELINSLQALTQGGLATMDPGRLEMTVRRAYNLSRVSGMGMDGLMQTMGQAVALSDRFGMDRQFGVQAALGSAAFSQAYANVGGGDVPFFGSPDRERVHATDMLLRSSAAASPAANQFNAALYIAKNFMDPNDPRLNGTRFGAMVGALQSGQTSYSFNGATFSVYSGQPEFLQMLREANINPGLGLSLLNNPRGTQEMGLLYDTGDIARRMQRGLEVEPTFTALGAPIIESGLSGRGLDTTTMGRMSRAAVQAIFGMDKAEFADPAKRISRMVDAMHTVAPDVPLADLRPIAATLYARFGNEVRSPGGRFSSAGTFENLVIQMRPEMFDEQTRIQGQVEAEAELQRAFSRVGRAGPLQRLSQALQSGVTSDTDLGRLVSEVMGGLDAGVVAEVGQGPLKEAMGEVGRNANAYHSAKSAADRRRAMERLQVSITKLQTLHSSFDVPNTVMQSGIAQDLAAGLASGDSSAVGALAAMADEMLTSRPDLEVLGRGGAQKLREIQSTARRVAELERSSGKSLARLLAEGNPEAKALQASLSDQMKAFSAFDHPKRATGANAMGPEDVSAHESALKDLYARPEMLLERYDALAGMDGRVMTEQQIRQRQSIISDLKQNRQRRTQLSSALSSVGRLQQVAEAYGLDTSSLKTPGQLVGALQNIRHLLSNEDQDVLDRAKPLAGLPADLTLDAVQKAFPTTDGGPGSVAPPAASRGGGPGNMKISGEVRFRWPNFLVFEDVNAKAEGPAEGRESHSR